MDGIPTRSTQQKIDEVKKKENWVKKKSEKKVGENQEQEVVKATGRQTQGRDEAGPLAWFRRLFNTDNTHVSIDRIPLPKKKDVASRFTSFHNTE